MGGTGVYMIGWEYPPFNSGGLGVACEGITQALAQQNTQIYFTLPHSFAQANHMQLVPCVMLGPDNLVWDSQSPVPNYLSGYAMAPAARTQQSVDEPLSTTQLHSLPTSDLEYRVNTYADQVATHAWADRRHFDVVHAHDWMAFPAGMAASAATGKPLITHIHSTEHDRIPSGLGSQFIHQTEYQGLRAATRVIAVSKYTKQLLVSRYAVDPNKIDVVYNGISPLHQAVPALGNWAGQRPVIVFMGRLTAQKGAPYFLQLAQAVLMQLPSALFVVAGDGDMYHELLFAAAGRGLTSHVLFSGFSRGLQRERLLNRATVFVMPSLSEPFGLVALEAAQHHTPIIISKNSGVAEVMPNATVLDFWDVEAMTAKVVELSNQPLQAKAQVAAQLGDLQHLSWSSSAQQIRHVYRRAMFG